MARKEKGHDEAPALITNHVFAPKRGLAQWWSLCNICNLGEAAHAKSVLEKTVEHGEVVIRDTRRSIVYSGEDETAIVAGGIQYVGDDDMDD